MKSLLRDKVDGSFIDRYFTQYDIRKPFQFDLSIPESFRLIKEEFIDGKKYYKFEGEIILERKEDISLGDRIILIDSDTGLPFRVIIYDKGGKMILHADYNIISLRLDESDLKEFEIPSLEQVDITEETARYLEWLYQEIKSKGMKL